MDLKEKGGHVIYEWLQFQKRWIMRNKMYSICWQHDESSDDKVSLPPNSPCLMWKMLDIIESLICCHGSVSTCIHRLFLKVLLTESWWLTCARITVCGWSGADVPLSRRRIHVWCLDDEGLLMVRQRLDVPPHSQPPGHTGKVGSLNTDREMFHQQHMKR